MVKMLSADVGGCCGCFTTRYRARVTFERDMYYLGETAKVHVVIDNSQCNTDVEYVKLVLYRRHWAKEEDDEITRS